MLLFLPFLLLLESLKTLISCTLSRPTAPLGSLQQENTHKTVLKCKSYIFNSLVVVFFFFSLYVFISRLSEEITDFCNFMSPTFAEERIRLLTIRRIGEAVSSLWPSAQVKAFGSFDTKLYMPSSDLDIVVLDDSLDVPSCLYQLANELKKRKLVSRIEVLAKTKVTKKKLICIKCIFNELSLSSYIALSLPLRLPPSLLHSSSSFRSLLSSL